jgi:hypothetical protein
MPVAREMPLMPTNLPPVISPPELVARLPSQTELEYWFVK